MIGMFGEDTSNASGNKLISFLNEIELFVCNNRKLVVEPEWTRVRPSLKQKSITDYDEASRKVSGDMCRCFRYWMLRPLFSLDGSW